MGRSGLPSQARPAPYISPMQPQHLQRSEAASFAMVCAANVIMWCGIVFLLVRVIGGV